MPIYRIPMIAGAVLAAAIAAAPAQEPPEQASEEAAAQETPEEIAARELCMETAAPGAHDGWAIREGRTCENSFAETCTVKRKADGAEVSYACYAPMPPMEENAEAGDEDEEPEGEE